MQEGECDIKYVMPAAGASTDIRSPLPSCNSGIPGEPIPIHFAGICASNAPIDRPV